MLTNLLIYSIIITTLILNKCFNCLERKEMNINITNKAIVEIKKVLKEKNSTSASKKIRIFLAGIG